jgi:hypothetical protein
MVERIYKERIHLINQFLNIMDSYLPNEIESGINKNLPKYDVFYKELIELLKVYRFDKKVRYGNKTDGGYVIAELEGEYDAYISAGISDEESFSRDFIEKYRMSEYNSFGFDGTIDTYPYEYTNKISFIKKNIANWNDDCHSNLSFLMEKYDNIFLKMDIEGGEYPWLLHLNTGQLNTFKQIVIELHGITNDEWGTTYYNKITCLEKLAETHYLVHAHGNNHSPIINGIPDVIELTYVHKKIFHSIPEFNTQPLPIPNIDFTNNRNVTDFKLNYYPFVITSSSISENYLSNKKSNTSSLIETPIIPKILFQTSKEKPEKYIIVNLLSKCPGWDYMHFNDEEILHFFQENVMIRKKVFAETLAKLMSGIEKHGVSLPCSFAE